MQDYVYILVPRRNRVFGLDLRIKLRENALKYIQPQIQMVRKPGF